MLCTSSSTITRIVQRSKALWSILLATGTPHIVHLSEGDVEVECSESNQLEGKALFYPICMQQAAVWCPVDCRGISSKRTNLQVCCTNSPSPVIFHCTRFAGRSEAKITRYGCQDHWKNAYFSLYSVPRSMQILDEGQLSKG